MELLNKQDLDKLVGEPFEKFLSRLDLKCPEPIDAIPVEWIGNYALSTNNGNIFYPMFLEWYIEEENGSNR